ncbi:homoaconitase / isopropylmalate isomerase, large subunit [Arcobacter venerupis]|jgi:homoaconitate hydratase family protein|uniref:3-isopropylmalate dehydratase large subunit n=1 Tax=Arcobacter venerupis TaxID=1054033 RepID=A0AAE7B718_9BACT|nr:3-isopropylmalate dehydratase large subunit [Arcobacter venerupis]QKF66543.1 homoaconitase / isopropylmalate isomerase, large subunit [Arcobacter venerupis]RWS49718.1 3-isopropylmalate dehydratase large subunit [Arcobacter venerupis]
MHAIEKLLAKKAGKSSVKTGEIVNCEVDMAGINDLYLQTIKSFFEMGAKKVFNPSKVIMFLDHYAPPSTITQAQNQKEFREFCWDQGIELLMDIDQGVCHQVLADKGLSYPGEIVVITDSHTTTHGAFGAFGTGVGATDLAIILATGKLWFRVPEIIKINFEGIPARGVYAKDMILNAIGQLGADFAVYKAVEFSGSALKHLNISERMAMCNMSTEMGAKTSYIQPDEITMKFLEQNVSKEYEIFYTDEDFKYEAEITIDISDLKPQIAAPFSVDNVFDISKFIGQEIDQAYLGSCTGGRAEDIAIAASILKDKKVSSRTRFIIVPASKEVFLESMRRGDVQTLVTSGATFVTPGCAACLGTHEGMLASGERCITTTNRNFPGRMGHASAQIFLGSPAAVAAAALEGKIVDPSNYIN